MITLQGVGKVYTVTQSEHDRPDGTKGLMAQLKFVMPNSRKEKGEWIDDDIWVEATAWDKQAEAWLKFSQWDIIEAIGTPQIRTFIRNDGTPGYGVTLRGVGNFGSPTIRLVPKGRQVQEDNEVAF